MSSERLHKLLQGAARAFEADVVVPHCVRCSRPCCSLQDVVLELDFGQVQRLYKIEKPKKDFDRALPSMIKRQGDRYYAHGERCPAYDPTTKLCTVYGTRDKPQECSDFPVYDDGDVVTADLRCEAVRNNLERLRSTLRAAVADVVEEADDEFADTFVCFSVPKAKKRSFR